MSSDRAELMVADVEHEPEATEGNSLNYFRLLSAAFGLRAAAFTGFVVSAGAMAVVAGLGGVFDAPASMIAGPAGPGGSTCCPFSLDS